MSNNMLTGSIPAVYSSMTALQSANFDDNALTGVVPDGLFASMPNLTYVACDVGISPYFLVVCRSLAVALAHLPSAWVVTAACCF